MTTTTRASQSSQPDYHPHNYDDPQDAPVDGNGIPFVYAIPVCDATTSEGHQEEEEYELNREGIIGPRPPAVNPASTSFRTNNNTTLEPSSLTTSSSPQTQRSQVASINNSTAATIPQTTTYTAIPLPVGPIGGGVPTIASLSQQNPYQSSPQQQQPISSHPPAGIPDGGVWGQGPSIGPATWGICGFISIFTCFFMCLPCGLWALLCPCDKQMLYKVQGKVYDVRGRYVGTARGVRFQPL